MINETLNHGQQPCLHSRGDHIVPNFEEIWPSKKAAKERPKRGLEYYYDAMMNGPSLSGNQSSGKIRNFSAYIYHLGFLPLPPNFTTVGKPNIVVNQYDSPLDVYSEDTLEEMKEERLTMQNPEVMERIEAVKPPQQNPVAAMQQRIFDPSRSNVLSAIDD